MAMTDELSQTTLKLEQAEKVILDVMGLTDYFREQLAEAKKELRKQLSVARKEAREAVDHLYGLHVSTCSVGLIGRCEFCLFASSFLSQSPEAE